jgi:magnesium transporter
MSEITGVIFSNGKSTGRVTLEGSMPQHEDSRFIWVEVQDPQVGEFAILQSRFHLHNLAVDDSMSPRLAPKVDVYDDQIFVVLRTARLEGDEIVYAEIDAFVSEHHIITVQHGEDADYASARKRFQTSTREAFLRPDVILHAILDFVVDSYFPVVQMIEDEVLDMEQQFLDGFLDRDGITRLFRLRREAIHFQRVVTKMSDVCGKLSNLAVPCVGPDIKPYIRDVHDRLLRLDTLIAVLIDVIGAVFQASNLLEQQRQGTITRQLAAWAGILAVPTAMSGVYSMNFANMPGVDLPYGYPVAIAVMLAICLGLYARFKVLGWL